MPCVPSGAPDQPISGETAAPSQVNLEGIAPPSRKAGLVILNGASGGAPDGEAEAGVVAVAAVAAAMAVAVVVGVGCPVAAPVLVAGVVVEVAHPASTRVSDASQSLVIRRMAAIIDPARRPRLLAGLDRAGEMRDTTRDNRCEHAGSGPIPEDLRTWRR
jgi:hypothetical protein